MSDLSLSPRDLRSVQAVIGVLTDPTAPLEDRAAAYAALQPVKLRIDRALKASRDDVIVGMERGGYRSLGPLTIKSTAVDPSYPCNAPENHEDTNVQDAMTALLGNPATRPYVRRIPAHLEIAVDVLAHDVQMGVQAAIDLYRALNRRGWRKEEARRLSLAVREPKAKKEAAA